MCLHLAINDTTVFSEIWEVKHWFCHFTVCEKTATTSIFKA